MRVLRAHFAATIIVNSAAIPDLALVSSASLVQAVASSIQGSRGPSASRRQWSACVLYVSASSSKRSASIWFMAEVSQRQPPPALTLGHGNSAVKGLADVPGVMMVEVVAPVVVSAMMTTNLAAQPERQACAIARRPRGEFPWLPDLARLRPGRRLPWPCDDIPLLSVSCRPARY